LKSIDMETNMTHFQLSSEQTERASALVTPALSFVLEHTFGLGTALVQYHWHDGAAQDVIDELGTYQNEDGGFGRNLEVDIKSSASNPFAARLAMGILLSLRDRPSSPLIAELEIWLRDNQHADGDWHFSDDVYKGELPPWFAAWSFPGLNPACCIAGLANRLGIASPDMLDRVERLFAENALIGGTLMIEGEPVDVSRISCPLVLLSGATDHITPPAQVFALADAASTPPEQVTRLTTTGGHLGLFMGHEALEHFWPLALQPVLAASV